MLAVAAEDGAEIPAAPKITGWARVASMNEICVQLAWPGAAPSAWFELSWLLRRQRGARYHLAAPTELLERGLRPWARRQTRIHGLLPGPDIADPRAEVDSVDAVLDMVVCDRGLRFLCTGRHTTHGIGRMLLHFTDLLDFDCDASAPIAGQVQLQPALLEWLAAQPWCVPLAPDDPHYTPRTAPGPDGVPETAAHYVWRCGGGPCGITQRREPPACTEPPMCPAAGDVLDSGGEAPPVLVSHALLPGPAAAARPRCWDSRWREGLAALLCASTKVPPWWSKAHDRSAWTVGAVAAHAHHALVLHRGPPNARHGETWRAAYAWAGVVWIEVVAPGLPPELVELNALVSGTRALPMRARRLLGLSPSWRGRAASRDADAVARDWCPSPEWVASVIDARCISDPPGLAALVETPTGARVWVDHQALAWGPADAGPWMLLPAWQRFLCGLPSVRPLCEASEDVRTLRRCVHPLTPLLIPAGKAATSAMPALMHAITMRCVWRAPPEAVVQCCARLPGSNGLVWRVSVCATPVPAPLEDAYSAVGHKRTRRQMVGHVLCTGDSQTAADEEEVDDDEADAEATDVHAAAACGAPVWMAYTRPADASVAVAWVGLPSLHDGRALHPSLVSQLRAGSRAHCLSDAQTDVIVAAPGILDESGAVLTEISADGAQLMFARQDGTCAALPWSACVCSASGELVVPADALHAHIGLLAGICGDVPTAERGDIWLSAAACESRPTR